MTETTIGSGIVANATTSRTATLLNGNFLPRFVAGLAILLAWELVVRAAAPAYVAKPTTVALAIPRVITDPVFLQAFGSTLLAVAEGLAITLVAGTVIGNKRETVGAWLR